MLKKQTLLCSFGLALAMVAGSVNAGMIGVYFGDSGEYGTSQSFIDRNGDFQFNGSDSLIGADNSHFSDAVGKESWLSPNNVTISASKFGIDGATITQSDTGLGVNAKDCGFLCLFLKDDRNPGHIEFGESLKFSFEEPKPTISAFVLTAGSMLDSVLGKEASKSTFSNYLEELEDNTWLVKNDSILSSLNGFEGDFYGALPYQLTGIFFDTPSSSTEDPFFNASAAVPEPTTMTLLSLGLLGLGSRRVFKR